MKTKLIIVALFLSATIFAGNTNKTDAQKTVVITEKALFLDGTLFLEFNNSVDINGTLFYYCLPSYNNVDMVIKKDNQITVFFKDGENIIFNI